MADFGTWLGRFADVVNTVNETVTGFNIGQEIATWIVREDRDTAMQRITLVVQNLSPDNLDRFERAFVQTTLGLFDANQRIRAMELYSWLKIQECAHYKTFRGFCFSGDRIA